MSNFTEFDFGLDELIDQEEQAGPTTDAATDPARDLDAWAAQQLADRPQFAAIDIETQPLDDKTLAALCPPCEAPPHPGEFDPSAVKCGNIGGPESVKGKAKIEEKRREHETAVADYTTTCAAARLKNFADFKDRAALSPLTGRIVAIGYGDETEQHILGSNVVADVTEKAMLRDFWKLVEGWLGSKTPIVGHNFKAFDAKFLVLRSLFHGLDIPVDFVRLGSRFPQWSPLIFDTMEVMAFGQSAVKGMGLDAVGRFFGCGGKTEGVDGKFFGQLWQDDHAKAAEYLKTDVRVTAAIARKLLLV